MSVFGSDVESKETLEAVIGTLNADTLQALKVIDAMVTAHRQALLADLDEMFGKQLYALSGLCDAQVAGVQQSAAALIQSLDGWRIEISVGGTYGTLVAPKKEPAA